LGDQHQLADILLDTSLAARGDVAPVRDLLRGEVVVPKEELRHARALVGVHRHEAAVVVVAGSVRGLLVGSLAGVESDQGAADGLVVGAQELGDVFVSDVHDYFFFVAKASAAASISSAVGTLP
jgi:hypothetical protein